jgi:pimeloyl-ACP methyl ester carboxylesterase
VQAEKQVSILDQPDWLPPQEWPFRSRSIELDGHRIHFVDEGEGPILVFVHAGLWSFLWRDVILRLRTRFRCVALDFPGSGLSTAASGHRPSLAGYSRILERFVDELDLSDITLVVHDLGGPIALALAGRRPELIRGLVVAQSFAWRTGPILNGMLRFMGSALVRWVMTRTNILMRATASRFGVGRHLTKAGRRAFLGPMQRTESRAVIHHLMKETAREARLLGNIARRIQTMLRDRPLLMLIGERNDPGGYYQRHWEALLPRSSKKIIRKGYHFPMCDDPDLCASAIEDWEVSP